MPGILGYSYADAGALVGGLVGGFTPAGFVGSAVLSGTLAGVGAAMDGRDMSGVLTEAGVAAIGAAGGGWAGGELARAGMKLLAPRLAKAAVDGTGGGLTGGLQKFGLEAAETVLRTTGRHDAGIIPAVTAGFAGFWATDQGKMPTVVTIDIGNGGCPVEMRSLQMPAELGGTVGDMYRKLPPTCAMCGAVSVPEIGRPHRQSHCRPAFPRRNPPASTSTPRKSHSSIP